MSRQPNQSAITYASVVDAFGELIKQGDKPTLRKLREHIGGGSYSTLYPLYHRWQEEQSLAPQVDADLSDAFRKAALAEIGLATATLEQKFTEQLDTEKARLKEAQSLLAECETQIQELKEDMGINQRTAEHKLLKLERELAAANALVEDGAKREASCQSQVDTLRQEVHQAELKAAVSETQLKELEKQNHRLEQAAKGEK